MVCDGMKRVIFVVDVRTNMGTSVLVPNCSFTEIAWHRRHGYYWLGIKERGYYLLHGVGDTKDNNRHHASYT